MKYVIGALLIALAAWAVWQTARRAKRGGGCCGERAEAPEKVRVRDRNKAHYPYEMTLNIGGMTCENCARRVENALNSIEGAWAAVDISRHTALVRSKRELTGQTLRDKVREAGYVVLP